MRAEGDIEGAALLERRLESAERAARHSDLAKIDERFRLGDSDGLGAACNAWMSSHSILEFDDPAGRQDVARVLERWPQDDPGSWTADPRGAIVRFFLDGRESDAPAKGLERAVSALAGVPDYVQARVLLLSGDEPGAENMAHRSPTAGSFEWTRYVLDLARASLRRGDAAAARRALERLPSGALGECGALIVRRDVALAVGDRDAASSSDRDLTAATGLSRPPDPNAGSRVVSPSEWLSPGTLSLCIDPVRARGRVLSVDLNIGSNSEIPQSSGSQIAQSRNRAIEKSPALALVSYGWNQGRSGSLLVSGHATLTVPLDGFEGRRNFWVRATLGSSVEASASLIAK